MKKDDREILKEVQKNAGMALTAITVITDKAYEETMKYELARESMAYADLYRKAAKNLLCAGEKAYQKSAVEDKLLTGAIHMNTLTNSSTGRLAELMIQGSNRGILSMWKSMNHNKEAEGISLELAKELMDFEEKCIERLKKYL